MTGPQLHALLTEFFNANPRISRQKVGLLLRGRRCMMHEFLIYHRPQQKTIDKVLAFIANPQGDIYKIPSAERLAKAHATRRANAKPKPPKAKKPPMVAKPKARTPKPENERKRREATGARIRRQITEAAEANLAAGVDPLSVSRAHVRHAMYALQAKRLEENWAPADIMAAIVKLQRKYRPVCSAHIVGGRRGEFVVGARRVSTRELLEMAG